MVMIAFISYNYSSFPWTEIKIIEKKQKLNILCFISPPLNTVGLKEINLIEIN